VNVRHSWTKPDQRGKCECKRCDTIRLSDKKPYLYSYRVESNGSAGWTAFAPGRPACAVYR
jgi:hypothetical protein